MSRQIEKLKAELMAKELELAKVLGERDALAASLPARDARMKAEVLRDYSHNLTGADRKFIIEAAEDYQDKEEESAQ